jgi:hypothetical protein
MSLLIDNRDPGTQKSSRRLRPRDPWRELASRRSAGITVGLFWRPEDDQITVKVSDELTGESFVLEPPKSAALEAFYHPYAVRSGRPELVTNQAAQMSSKRRATRL